MKVLPTIISAAAATVTYKDILWNIREGKPLPAQTDKTASFARNFASWEDCPTLDKGNLEKLECDQEYCVGICPPGAGHLPLDPNNPNVVPKVRCKKGIDGNPNEWNRALPTCSSCDPDNFDSKPEITDDFIDMICHVGTKNMKICKLTCKNGELLNGKRRDQVACRLHVDEDGMPQFRWSTNKEKSLLEGSDTTAFACPRNPLVGPTDSSNSCMTKDPTCTTLGQNAIKYMNNWTCRNCFRIQANYKFSQYKIKNWEDKDYLEIYFRYKIQWLNVGHPVESVEQIGDKGNRWRVYFKPGANFMSGMRWDANLKTVQNQWVKDDNIIRGSASCPCSNSVGSTPAPWN